MFCEKCGKENTPESKFCKSCGHPLRTEVVNQAESQSTTPDSTPVQTVENTFPDSSASNNETQGGSSFVKWFKSIPKKVLIGGSAAVVAIIVLFTLFIINAKTIDLNRYVKIESKGVNGFGTVTATIDWAAMEKEHSTDLEFSDEAKKELGGFINWTSPFSEAKGSINLSLDKDKGLSNGDTVTYKWKIDDDFSRYFKARLKYSEGTYTVSNLKEVATFDAFANVELNYSGVAPNGSVSVSYKGSELSSYYFSVDKSTGLKNGDTIKVSIASENMEEIARNYGKVPEAQSKEYTVSGIPEYVSAYSGITEDFLTKAKKEAEDQIASNTTSSFMSREVKNVEYVGYYFKTAKDTAGWFSKNNILYLVYSGDVYSPKGEFQTKKVYFPVRFTDVKNNGKGEYVYSDVSIAGYSTLEKFYTVSGYTSGEEMYKSIITEDRDKYNYEVSETLKQFGQ